VIHLVVSVSESSKYAMKTIKVAFKLVVSVGLSVMMRSRVFSLYLFICSLETFYILPVCLAIGSFSTFNAIWRQLYDNIYKTGNIIERKKCSCMLANTVLCELAKPKQKEARLPDSCLY